MLISRPASKQLIVLGSLILTVLSTELRNQDGALERGTIFKRLQTNFNPKIQKVAKAASVSLERSGVMQPNFKLERIIKVTEEELYAGVLYEMLLMFVESTDTYERTTVCMAQITDGFDGKRNYTRLHTPPSACLSPLEIHLVKDESKDE